MRLRRAASIVVTAAVVLAGAAPSLAAQPVSAEPGPGTVAEAPQVAGRAAKTTVSLKVAGCDDCTVQPVQNRGGTLTYTGPQKTVMNDKVVFRVPTTRTRDMAFLVYAPFDEWAQGGIPMVVVTGFKAKEVGATVSDSFVAKPRKVSGCWAGTTKPAVSNTLVVKKRQQQGKTVAAGWLRRTWKSSPYWRVVTGGSYHSSDPSICK